MAGVIPDPLQRGTPPSAANPPGNPPSNEKANNPNWQSWGGGGNNTSNTWRNFNAPANPGGALPPPDSGGSSGSAMSAYEDGGDVGDDSSQGGGTASLGDVLNTIKDTLNYGRQQAMGKSTPGAGMDTSQMRPSTNVEDERGSSTVGQAEGPQPKMGAAGSPLGAMPAQTAQPYPYGPQVGVGQSSAGAGPVLGMDDGGDVNNPAAQGMPPQPQANQPAPQPGQVATNATPPPAMGGAQPRQGQPPNKLAGYVMGAGAVSPDVAQALKQRVDPTGQMDPTMRNMLAIAAAPDQQTKWGMMQHDRQKFNAYAAFARAAAAGTPQKPADIGAAANAATSAFAHIPDGTSTTFQPTQNGVIAHVKPLMKGKASAHKDGGPVQGFDDGGGVLPDFIGGTGDNSETESGGEGPSTAQKGGSIGTPDQDVSQDQGAPEPKSFAMNNQQFQAMLAKMPWDAVMGKGAAETLAQYTATNEATPGSPQQIQTGPYNSNDAIKNVQGANGQYSQVGPSPAQTETNPNDLTAAQDVSVLPEHATPAQIKQFNQSNGGVNRQGSEGQFAADENGNVPGMRQVGAGAQYAVGTPEQRTQRNAIELQQEKNKGELAKQTEANKAWNVRTAGMDSRNALTNLTRLQIAQGNAARLAISNGERNATAIANNIRNNVPGTSPGDAMKAAIQSIQDFQRSQGQQGAQPQQGGQPQQNNLSSQDQAALAWAQANPTDPRAAQIKQRLGM